MLELIAIELVTLHMLDGRLVHINPAQVTQVINPREEGGALVKEVNCVIRLTDGTYVSVVEPCVEVEKLLEGAKP